MGPARTRLVQREQFGFRIRLRREFEVGKRPLVDPVAMCSHFIDGGSEPEPPYLLRLAVRASLRDFGPFFDDRPRRKLLRPLGCLRRDPIPLLFQTLSVVST